MHTDYQHVVRRASQPNNMPLLFAANNVLFNERMSTFSDRIAEAAAVAGGQSELARKLSDLTKKSVTQSLIGYLIKGRPDRSPPRSSEMTPYIAEIAGFNVEWLATGRGEKLKSGGKQIATEYSDETAELTPHFRVEDSTKPHYHARTSTNLTESPLGTRLVDIPCESTYIPIFNATASMGSGRDLPEIEYQIGAMQLSNDWLRQHLNISNPSHLAVISADGDSMAPTFSSGDLLLIDRMVDRIKTDAVYALALEGQLYVKRLRRNIDDGSVDIISDNPSYGTQRISRDRAESLHVAGRVVFAWRGSKL